MKTPLEYGKLACDAFIHKFEPQMLPPVGTLFYHQGVCLSGMQNIYKLCGDKKYFNYIKDYVDSVIGPNGEIIGIKHELNTPETADLAKRSLEMLDHRQPIILFYNLYEETKDEKYMNAIKTVGESMYFWPVNRHGGYWHMMIQHNQMWLDGAYMAGPLSCMYANLTGDPTLRERAIKQIFLMDDHMKDPVTGLYYHGWDDSYYEPKQPWADEKTGLSGQFWSRAVGWYAVAIMDILDLIPSDHPACPRLKQIETDLLRSLAKVQDPKTGMWFEVLDKIDEPDNWVESSGTNLFIYAYAKAVRLGVVSKEEFGEVIEKAYKGSIDSTYMDEDGYFVIDKVCVGTCIDAGTYEHYINRAQIKNDLHGGGAFLLMCAEMERYRQMNS